MPDLFAMSTKYDIDNNTIDIDNILCFNEPTFLIEQLIRQETGEETPRQ
jgi:hypothetical protein